MKIDIITMHRIYNYGSVLQTYATQEVFKKAGFDVEIVDYISKYRTKKCLFKDYPPRLERKRLKRFIYYIAKVPSFLLKDITFGRFISHNLQLSKRRYITVEDLINNPPAADIYCSGSDQVWNSKYNKGIDRGYYLDFLDDKKIKIAYVSSFGASQISRKEQQIVGPMLKNFSLITVREDEAINILRDMGIQGSKCLIDPTLQISNDEWCKLASKRLVQNRYLLLFLLYNEDNGASEIASQLATKHGLKVVKLSWELIKPKGVDYLFTHRPPEDFLSLFLNADFIVTNSFHGVAFSINLNRNFMFVPRTEFNGRIESLLRLVNLENRNARNRDKEEIFLEQIDYNRVNSILDFEREKCVNTIAEIKKIERRI